MNPTTRPLGEVWKALLKSFVMGIEAKKTGDGVSHLPIVFQRIVEKSRLCDLIPVIANC